VLDMGVDGLITDYPDRARVQITRRGLHLLVAPR
jgi:glycerophosphoryl diester phosphodiesterase